ncbi:MAG: hypothetical protein ABIS12_12095 [Bacteroidia bacterium]
MNQTNLQAELEQTPSLIDGDTVLLYFSFNNHNMHALLHIFQLHTPMVSNCFSVKPNVGLPACL